MNGEILQNALAVSENFLSGGLPAQHGSTGPRPGAVARAWDSPTPTIFQLFGLRSTEE